MFYENNDHLYGAKCSQASGKNIEKTIIEI